MGIGWLFLRLTDKNKPPTTAITTTTTKEISVHEMLGVVAEVIAARGLNWICTWWVLKCVAKVT